MKAIVRQAHRGKELENRIEKTLTELHNLGLIVYIRIEVKQARVRGHLQYTKRQPFDYMVVAPSGVWGIDAKECSAAKWYPSQAPAHQVRAMQKMQALGHRAGFLVWFKCAGVVDSMRLIEDFSAPATVESGIAFDWNLFLRG